MNARWQLRVTGLLTLTLSFIALSMLTSVVLKRLKPSVEEKALQSLFVTTLEGQNVSLKRLADGHPTVFVFASPECGHCSAEIDIVDRVQALHQTAVQTIVIADSHSRSTAELKAFAVAHPLQSVYFDVSDVRQKLGLHMVPALLGLDARGKITGVLSGQRTPDYISSFFRKTAEAGR